MSGSGMTKFGANTGQYSSASSGFVYPSGNTSYSGPAQFSGQPSFNHPVSVPILATSSRQTYGSNYGNCFNEELLDPYTMPGTQYVLPAHDFTAPSSNYPAQDISRHSWRPMNTNHSSHLSPSLEQETTIRYGTSGFPYYTSSASSGSSAMTDGSGPFPGLGSLATSLPLHANNANRTLPNPNAKRGSIQSITNGHGALPDSPLSYCMPPNIGGKSSVSWSTENVPGGGAQGPITSMPVATGGVTEGPNGKPSTPTRTSRDNSNFGYYTMSHTPMTMSSPQPAEYLPTTLAEPSNPDSQIGSTDALYHPRVSGDNSLSSQSPSSNLYSYSVVSTGRYGSTTDSIVSEGTLSNGQPYTRLRQPEPHHVTSLDSLRGGSLEPNSRHAQRNSISSASTRHY
jgi:hypothetical protein